MPWTDADENDLQSAIDLSNRDAATRSNRDNNTNPAPTTLIDCLIAATTPKKRNA